MAVHKNGVGKSRCFALRKTVLLSLITHVYLDHSQPSRAIAIINPWFTISLRAKVSKTHPGSPHPVSLAEPSKEAFAHVSGHPPGSEGAAAPECLGDKCLARTAPLRDMVPERVPWQRFAIPKAQGRIEIGVS